MWNVIMYNNMWTLWLDNVEMDRDLRRVYFGPSLNHEHSFYFSVCYVAFAYKILMFQQNLIKLALPVLE